MDSIYLIHIFITCICVAMLLEYGLHIYDKKIEIKKLKTLCKRR